MDNHTTIITILIAIVGVIIGSLSLVRQFWKERPQFDFEITKVNWYYCDQYKKDNDYVISVETILLNKGERNTAIHTTRLTFNYKGKPHQVKLSEPLGIQLNGGDSKKYTFFFKISEHEIQIDDDITNVKITIHFTHKPKVKTIDVISKSTNNPVS